MNVRKTGKNRRRMTMHSFRVTRILRWTVVAVVAALVSSASVLPVSAVGEAGPDHVVHAGAVNPGDPLSTYIYMDYFPRQLKVHRGDWVRWEFPMQVSLEQAFHTVTFSDPDTVPLIRSDELPGTLAFDEGTMWSTCGRPGQPICVISDTNTLVSSGTPLIHSDDETIHPFDAIIDLPKGRYTYFCTIHHPAMQGSVEVVDDAEAAVNPAPADFADVIHSLTAEADAHFAELSKPVLDPQTRTWQVNVGGRTRDVGGVAEAKYFPASLEIRPGDRVHFEVRDEIHGVLFPDVGSVPLYSGLSCEFDEPNGGLPGVPALGTTELFGVPCPPGSVLEAPITPLGAERHRAPGNAVGTPATLHNSGLMVDPAAPDRMRRVDGTGEAFPSTFDAEFPVASEVPFAYRCYVHFEVMGGSIKVTEG